MGSGRLRRRAVVTFAGLARRAPGVSRFRATRGKVHAMHNDYRPDDQPGRSGTP